MLFRSSALFQSTPSVGRETTFRTLLKNTSEYFNPLPPWGGRHFRERYTLYAIHISIHSLRGEGDRQRIRFKLLSKIYFNPLPPWGGRHQNCTMAEKSTFIQSTILTKSVCLYILTSRKKSFWVIIFIIKQVRVNR